MSHLRKWNLLLAGEKNGLVGALDDNFPSSPRHLERVAVVEIREILERLHWILAGDDIDALISDLERR